MKNKKIFKQIPKILFGKGNLSRLQEILPSRDDGDFLYMVDDCHKKTNIESRLTLEGSDELMWVNADKEPTTDQVDQIRDEILAQGKTLPTAIVAIGGGTVMDIGKAVSVMLKNEGSSKEYQGWDLVKEAGIFKVGVPTISGTGSEASRTTVLCSGEKKFGINSDFSMFDAILCDVNLLETVPTEQRFYTAMDCYIHCVESLRGTMINELAKAYATSGLELCREVFLSDANDEKLMVASFMGGASIVNSEVGVCHALSYGLSLVLGYHHGIANCIAFNVLDEFYDSHVEEMREMMKKCDIQLPKNVCKDLNEDQMQVMIQMTQKMEKPLINALGENYAEIMTEDKIRSLYNQM